jgi:hypothetical protein
MFDVYRIPVYSGFSLDWFHCIIICLFDISIHLTNVTIVPFSFVIAETYRTVLHSVELKKTTLQRSRKELEQTERDTEAKLIEIDNTNTELKVFCFFSFHKIVPHENSLI